MIQLFDRAKVNKHWRNNLILFVCIVLLFIIGPSISLDDKTFIYASFFSVLIISSVFVIDYTRVIRKLLFYTGFIIVVIVWLDVFFDNKFFNTMPFLLLSVFLFLITISLIVHVALSKNVNANIIFSAINGYLLLGIIGGISLLILDALGSNVLLNNIQNPGLKDYLYFSFVTLTTLGYGDLTPASDAGRVIAMLLAVTGQLYIAILIAMLVGKFLNNKR